MSIVLLFTNAHILAYVAAILLLMWLTEGVLGFVILHCDNNIDFFLEKKVFFILYVCSMVLI